MKPPPASQPLPPLQMPFATFALSPVDWLIIVPLSVSVVPVLELVKWLIRHGALGSLQ